MFKALTAALLSFATAACAEEAAAREADYEQRRKFAELQGEIAATEKQLADARTQARADFDVWMDKLPEGPHLPIIDDDAARFAFDTLDQQRTPNAVAGGSPAIAYGKVKLADGKTGRAAEFNGECGLRFPGVENFARDKAFTFALWIHAARQAGQVALLDHRTASNDSARHGSRILLENKQLTFEFHSASPEAALIVTAAAALDGWTHIATTYDGSSRADGVRIYLNGRRVESHVVRDTLAEISADTEHEPMLTLGQHAVGAEFAGNRVDDFRIFRRALSSLEIATIAGLDDYTAAVQSIPNPTPAQREAIFEFYVTTSHHASLAARAAIAKARADLRAITAARPPQ